jgi:hypothetical protein
MSRLPSAFVNLNRDNIEAYTPSYAVDILLPYLPKDKVIWAPFSRDEHNFADYLRGLGYTVHNTHYDPETGSGDDFLTYEPAFEWDVIADNPPFKGKARYVARAMEWGKPFALFLPFNCFGDNGIPKLFMRYGIEPQMLIPDQRTEFENQPKRGISFKTVYVCRDILPKQLIFTKLNKPSRRASARQGGPSEPPPLPPAAPISVTARYAPASAGPASLSSTVPPLPPAASPPPLPGTSFG